LVNIKMQLFKTIKVSILLMSIFSLFYTNDITAQATNADPGSGRLSGNHIDDGFYDDNSYNNTNPDIVPYDKQSSFPWYGATKTKSPYNKATYTHQSRFDDRTILHGIDVSKWQGEINWTKVKADGIDYAFIQVGYRGYGASGTLNEATRDPYFDTNMQNAIAAGIKVGVYVFSQATTEAEAIEEARYILDAIGGYNISMPLVMDFEYASTDTGLSGRLYKAKLSKSKATAICMAFCKEIADAGYTPMVYANRSMLTDQINADTLTDAGYRIWLANYTNKTTYSGVYDFWQYSEKGKVDGIYGDVDMNFYYMQPTDNFAPVETTIANSIFTGIENQTYTGTAIAPEITVTHNGIKLIPNVDYTLHFLNNTKVGVATVEITGIGAYTNTRRMQFEILPKPIDNLRAKKRTSSYITLSWNKDSSIKGYEIYRASSLNGTFEKIKTISKNGTISFKNTKLTAGKCYYYKIRSFKKVNGKNYYSEFSPVSTIYTKTGYTKLALTKYTTPIYDFIPGTKTETITTTEVVNQEPDDATTENATTENTTTETTTEATTEITTEVSTENTTEATTEATTENPTDNKDNETTNNNSSENENTDSSNNSSEKPTTDTSLTETHTTSSVGSVNEISHTGDTSTDNSSTDATTNNISTDTSAETITVTKTVNVDSATLASVKKNNALTIIYSTKYKKKTWYYVSYTVDDVTHKGFVSSTKVTTAKLGKIVKSKTVNVRKKNTIYSKRVTKLKKNAKVYILSTKKRAGVTWYKVRFKKNNKTYNGWISAPYVKGI